MVKAYLTIDDAPSEDFRQKIDFLISKNIRAIIFCIGKNMDERKDDVIYAIKSGFIIGNHSYSHPHFSKVSLEQCLNEIKRTDEIIEKIYNDSEIKRLVKVFRFPYGDKGIKSNFQPIQNFLKELGYEKVKFDGVDYTKDPRLNDIDIYWTFDVKEWKIISGRDGITTPKQVYDMIDEKKFDDSNEIILVHDHTETTSMFNDIIEYLISKDVRFIRFS